MQNFTHTVYNLCCESLPSLPR